MSQEQPDPHLSLHALGATANGALSIFGVFSIRGRAFSQFSEESGPLYEVGDFGILRKSAASLLGKEDFACILDLK
jgi:hypothetical protein